MHKYALHVLSIERGRQYNMHPGEHLHPIAHWTLGSNQKLEIAQSLTIHIECSPADQTDIHRNIDTSAQSQKC